MHPFVVLIYMREDHQDKPFEYIASVTPEAIPERLKHAPKPSLVPRDLFSRIMKRLGLEKELYLVKRHLGFFVTLLIIFSVLSVFAFIGVKQVLVESSFGFFISLIFSDPGIVIKYWHSFIFSVFESMPGITATVLLLSVTSLMLFIRLAALGVEKVFIIIKLINKQRYGHK